MIAALALVAALSSPADFDVVTDPLSFAADVAATGALGSGAIGGGGVGGKGTSFTGGTLTSMLSLSTFGLNFSADPTSGIYQAACPAGPFFGNTCLVLDSGTLGSTAYMESTGHLVVDGELHATDTALIYGKGVGTALTIRHNQTDLIAEGTWNDSGLIAVGSGTAAKPGIGFLAQDDGSHGTGLYLSGSPEMSIAIGGFQMWKFANDFGLRPASDNVEFLGSSSLRLSDVHSVSATVDAISVTNGDGATKVAGISNVGIGDFGNGTASVPSIGWLADHDGTGTGFFRASADTIGVTIGGTDEFRFNGTGFTSPTDNFVQLGDSTHAFSRAYSRRFVAGNGSLNTPAFAFLTDEGTNGTGFFMPTAGTIRFVTQGGGYIDFNGSGLIPTTDNFIVMGDATHAWLRVDGTILNSHGGSVYMTPNTTALATCVSGLAGKVTAYKKGTGVTEAVSMCACEEVAGVFAWKALSATGDCT